MSNSSGKIGPLVHGMIVHNSKQLLRQLPAVDSLLLDPKVAPLLQVHSREIVLEGIRKAIEKRRQAILKLDTQQTAIEPADIQHAIEEWLEPTFRPVINATGVFLHTNLGRAPLPELAAQRVNQLCTTYSNLEMNLREGKRGSRMDLIRDSLTEILGVQAALVVNNNAAATYLLLRSLACGREVIVSRGELVEIGGSFRIPDVMAASGATLCEVGCTNRTRIADYERHINPQTAMILKVYRSNFDLVGFTEEASIEQLVKLSRHNNLPCVVDMGSATLMKKPPEALKAYDLAQVMKKGPDLVCFSGDKLLGGPQAGIIVGQKKLVDQLASDPMARALRVDKMTLAALDACLSLYRQGEQSARQIPLIEMMSVDAETLGKRAELLYQIIVDHTKSSLEIELQETQSQVGGGSLPLFFLDSVAVVIRPKEGGVDRLAQALRLGKHAVLGRLQNDALWLDVRTLIGDEQVTMLAQAIGSAIKSLSGSEANR